MRDTTNVRLGRWTLVTGAVMALLLLSVPNASATADPFWAKQYGPTQIGAPIAWQKSTGKGVKVAVVDSGVDVDHPDLKKNLDLADSHDFGCGDDNPDDDSTQKDGEGKTVKGHGTHVTGTIAATANNNIGVAGVAPDVQIMVEKVFASNASCGNTLNDLTNTSQAINWAVNHGAKVINLSLSEFKIAGNLIGTIESPCRQAFNKGALCVIAAGNSGEAKGSGYAYDIPAMVVTANDNTGAHATFGQKADTMWGVSAPGVDILSTWPIDDPGHDGYNSIQGTSMAAPHVTGAAAILFGMGMSNKQVAEALVRTAGPARDSLVEGAGEIHVDLAAGFAPVATTLVPSKTGAPPVTSGGRSAAVGGAGPKVATTTTVPGPTGPSANFEEGIGSDDDSKDLNALRLKEASKNSAGKPFNAAGPLLGFSVVALVLTLGVAIPRLRAKDTPPLG